LQLQLLRHASLCLLSCLRVDSFLIGGSTAEGFRELEALGCEDDAKVVLFRAIELSNGVFVLIVVISLVGVHHTIVPLRVWDISDRAHLKHLICRSFSNAVSSSIRDELKPIVRLGLR